MNHIMGLQEDYFNDIKNGIKKYELRLNDEKRKQIKKGDIITFLKEPNRIESMQAFVTDLIYFKNFSDVIEKIDINLLASNKIKEELINDLNKYYSIEKQVKYGVVAIKIDTNVKYEKSCGTVTFKEMNHKRYYLLIHHNKGHWGFPKGHIENSETEEETAIRETKEETNVDSVIIPGFREVITYSPKENVMKDVVFFLANPKTDSLIPQEIEVSDVRWVEESEVMNLITYQDEKEIFEKVLSYIH